MTTVVACVSLLLIVASWLAIRWSEESRAYRQILCAPIDTTPEDEQ
jgi:hypothetical protein